VARVPGYLLNFTQSFVQDAEIMFKSYSSNGEDLLIQDALARLGVHQGIYIDVGASTPIEDSNTYALYERGFAGVCIEPQPHHAIEHRQARPRDIFIPALAGRHFGIETLWLLHAQQLATASSAFQEYWSTPRSAADPNKGYCGPDHRSQMEVPVVTLNAVIEKLELSSIHLLAIDVEGYEEHVLDGIDLDVHRPWIICAEATYPHSQRPADAGWREKLLARGYTEFAFDSVNRFFIANERRIG
jgi:FkbM family methyltransferase